MGERTELRLNLNSLVSVLERLGEREELCQGRRAVRVAASVDGVPLDGLGVVRY